MIAITNDADRYESEYLDSEKFRPFERFSYRSGGEFPVTAHSARIRARLRSRGTFAGRNKARSFNGAKRRGRGKLWASRTQPV